MTDTAKIELFCYIRGDEPRANNVFSVTIEKKASVSQLRERIWEERWRDATSGVVDMDLEVWKLNEPLLLGSDFGERIAKLPLDLTAIATNLEPWSALEECFTENPVKKHLHIIVVVDRSLQSKHCGCHDDSEDRFSEMQVATIRRTKAPSAQSPSVASKPVGFVIEQDLEAGNPVFNGRPVECHGLPITLFHPVFAKLKDALNNLNDISPTAEALAVTHDLFINSAATYEHETQRKKAVKPLVAKLLGIPSIPKLHQTDTTTAGDGFVVTYSKISASPALILLLVVKVELGSSGDGGAQAAYAYRRHIAQDEYTTFLEMTCCPCIIISIQGPYLSIMGGIYTQQAIVQPFTDYILLNADPFCNDRIRTVARIFHATAKSLVDLKTYYETLSAGPPNSQRFYPHPTFLDNVHRPDFTLHYEKMPDVTKAIYKASMNQSKTVFVKFSETYCVEAHRTLADKGLAPALYFCSRIAGGMFMTVMEYIDGEDACATNSLGVLPDLTEAISLLHEKNIVFGDLRLPNIRIPALPRSGCQAMLVDFDWAGKHGEARYPAVLNDWDKIKWAPGVERGAVMMMKHDNFMLELLQLEIGEI